MGKSLIHGPLAILLFAVICLGCSTSESPVQPGGDTGVGMREGGEITAGGPKKPTVTTTAAAYLTSANATSGGNVTAGSTVTTRGVCYATTTNPTTANAKVTSGSGTGAFTCVLNGLSANTTYYLRAYATNAGGTGYGSQISFTTKQSYGTVTDASGNVYSTITIGNQVWTVENLRTTKYGNGDDIDNLTDDTDWRNASSGAYCNYDNSSSNVSTYGRLYNWFAVNDSRSLAPSGYHVPSKTEWDTLIAYLGGSNDAGGRAKETGTTHWTSPNSGATNSSSFTAVPGGARYFVIQSDGDTISAFTHMGTDCPFWSTTASSSNSSNALFVEADYYSTRFYRSGFIGGFGYYDKKTGYAVRLVRD